VPLERIEPNPYQPRHRFDASELEGLKSSIAREGVLQPVLLRRTPGAGRGTGTYQLVAGERRFRASQELGLKTLPAIEVDVADERLLEFALIENIHRESLNPIDTAKAFRHLLQSKSWGQEELAHNLGLGRPTVTNTLRLLELPDNIQKALERGQIQMGHAKVLLSVTDAVCQQQLFDQIAEDRLSVRELETVRDTLPQDEDPAGDPLSTSPKKKRSGKKKGRVAKKPEIESLERELSQVLGTKVTIDEKKKGKGVLSIEFYSAEDFEHLRRLLLAVTGGA
jgi:ParB family chromosome partitioning protein